MKNRNRLRILATTASLGVLLGVGLDAHGQGAFNDGFGRVFDFRKQTGIGLPTSFAELILNILAVLTAVLAALALAALIYGGLLYITSGGDEDRAKKGRRVVLYAIMGIVLVALAGVLVNLVINLL